MRQSFPMVSRSDTFRREDDARGRRSRPTAGTRRSKEEWGFHALPFEEWWELRKADDKASGS